MRVTSQMSQSYSLYYMTRNNAAVSTYNNRVSAERQVLNLEDNPTAAINGIRITSVISRTQQYQRNIEAATGSMAVAETQLGSVKGIMDEIKSILTGAASEGTTTAQQRQTYATQLNDMLQQLLIAANAKDGERYLFGGTYTTSEPYTLANGSYVLYNGNDKSVSIQTGQSTSTVVNCTGSEAFGNLTTVVSSTGDLNPGVNLGTDVSTSLADLNGGSGVPKGKITIYYSSYPEGLEVDLSGCDTLEDVKDCIEKATLEASRNLDPAACSWLDGSNLDWRDLQDRYVEVTLNPDGNGISLREYDLGEPLPEPTAKETKLGLDYSGQPGYTAGDTGGGAGAVYEKLNQVYGNGSSYYSPLRVDDVAGNTVAYCLGIRGTANKYDPANPDSKLDGFIHGGDLNPILSKSTLLADLEGYNDAVYTITNGTLPGDIVISETTTDSNNVFNNWDLNNLSLDYNTGSNGDLYVRVTRRGPPDDDIYVEVYTKPLDKAKASDLVATGVCTNADGGTVALVEANDSGVSGSVGLLLPTTVDSATVNLSVDFGTAYQATVHVPAFVEEINPDGTSRDYLNILSGWSITGLDKAPAEGYDLNHPPSTDLDGDVSVNMVMVDNGDGTSSIRLELYRPAYGDVPATLIATGELNLGGTPPLDTATSGRIAITGVEGFEAVSGSVYVELPAGAEFASGTIGTGPDSATTLTYALTSDLAANTEIVLGGATELAADQTLATDMKLKADTLFLAGQTFATDINLPGGGVLPAGTPLAKDTLLYKGAVVGAGTTILAGTVLAEGQAATFSDPLAAGTVIPRGSYTTDGVTGFPADNMTSSDPAKAGQAMGFDLNATFATVEDLMRAVEEAGVYTTVQISANGTGLEFASDLAGAYLTVSEDTDCYEQMNDKYQQLSALDLNGLIKGVNTDNNGNVYTEVIYYPPDPARSDGKVLLVTDDGDHVLIDAGYYVRVYSDSDALDVEYENRDNSTMVAEGFIPAGEWDGTDPLNPYVPVAPATAVGNAVPLLLEERNDSGVSGTVSFDYYGGRDQAVMDAGGEYDYSPYNNADIAVAPGGLRTESSVHTVLQEIDIADFTPGVHCDYAGVAHCQIGWDQASGTTTVSVYRDTSRSHMTAKGELNGQTGVVTLYETDKNGDYRLDADGNRIEVGSLVVADNTLLDGQADNFTITMGALDASGQERETNIFSTITDCIAALNANDVEALHNLIDTLQADIDRLVAARAGIGSTMDQLDLLNERYADEIISYSAIYTSNIGMDSDALAETILNLTAAENAYNASLQIASRYLQMSLLDYLF